MPTLENLAADPRVLVRRRGAPEGHCVVYWMQRAQRARDNPALDLAVQAANLLGKPVVTFFAPVPFYPRANLRHYAFLAQGIPDIASELKPRGIGFVLRRYPEHSLSRFIGEVRAALVIGDENPMHEPELWRQRAAQRLRVPFWTVDADVIVPSSLLGKEQFAAHTIRPRLARELARFLVPSANPVARVSWKAPAFLARLTSDCDLTQGWQIDRSVAPVPDIRGGSREASRLMTEFVKHKLARYSANRNHPEINGTSRLSPYLHFGHISPVTVALAVRSARVPQREKDAFLDELITWRELAVNFVRFNPHYDNIESAERWAAQSLGEHARDPRPYLYSEAELERAETHDRLWNAAQMQMVRRGWMHNYMRMLWAKKILEWSPSPDVAYNIAVRLNDKYQMDGRDPNGYAGIAWAVAGKHDRAWFDKPVFGKVRTMSTEAAARKFDVKRYIQQQEQD